MSSTQPVSHFWHAAKARWSLKDDGYLPVSRTISHSSHNSSSSSILLKEESSSSSTSLPTLPFLSYSIKSISSSAQVRKLLLLALHLTSFIFGAIGVYTIVYYRHGHYIRVPVYSQYDISQAGYVRPLINSPPSSIPHSTEEHTEDNSPTPGQGAHHSQPTVFDTWTFPSSSSLSSDSTNTTTTNSAAITSTSSDDQHLLILSPIRNAQHLLPTYFKHLENLSHPKQNTSIGFLLSDEEDETGILVQHWCEEQITKNEYRSITLLRKDFGLLSPKGNARHDDWIQTQRRGAMARARTLLLTSTINPTHDWVFWLDVDVQEMSSDIIKDLLHLGQVTLHEDEDDDTSSSRKVLADIITPNIMYRPSDPLHNGIYGYDLNNWAETPASIEMKATLDEDVVLHEGDRARPTYRLHLAREWVAPNVTLDPFLPSLSSLPLASSIPYLESEDRTSSSLSSSPSKSNLYDPSSPAYIGKQIPLDAVGGVATLVRASVHLFGGVFPSWNVDHSIETEGFGVLAKLVGARIVGLPNYLVVHRT